MSDVTLLMRKPRLRIVQADDQPTERIFGSPGFIARDRNPSLAPPPRKFVPTAKRPGDVII